MIDSDMATVPTLVMGLYTIHPRGYPYHIHDVDPKRNAVHFRLVISDCVAPCMCMSFGDVSISHSIFRLQAFCVFKF